MYSLEVLKWSLLVVSCVLMSSSEGIICYECSNAKSDEDCARRGKLRVCSESQKSCQTTERINYAHGPFVRISKRCKQAVACQNNFDQNNKTSPQCKHFKELSVCRCCCTDDLCNFSTGTCTGVKNKRLLKEFKRQPTCPKLGTIKNGVMACDNVNKPGSSCEFRCLTFYDLYGSGSISCQMNKKKAKWSHQTPCCARPCPPHGDMDIVFGLDSSESADDWYRMKNFIKDIIRKFTIGDSHTRVGVVSFTDKVAEKEIFLSSHNSTVGIVQALDNLVQAKASEKGTRLGQLLNHINDVSLSIKRGNRDNMRDMVVIITSGSPIEEKTNPEIIAKRMRDKGIKIISVGVGLANNLDQVAKIAGTSTKTFLMSEGFDTISEAKYREEVLKMICGEPCLR